MEPRERESIIRARQGDLAAFAELVRLHDGYIMRMIRSMSPAEDAEDLWQETFIRAFTGLASFRAESGFRTWLTRIAIRQCLSHRRKGRWQRWIALPAASADAADAPREPASVDPLPDEQVLHHEMQAHLQRALAALPGSQRAAFVLKYVQGCSIREIAAILGKAEGTIKSDLFRAMQKVKARMQQIYTL
ncbi:MAG TPA: RNA polymerase sigma factor [bacterium]|nr:RNA polymerase sigma factor [bacterium]HPR88417.1 RNA polymerase sigma factor [bacterium]